MHPAELRAMWRESLRETGASQEGLSLLEVLTATSWAFASLIGAVNLPAKLLELKVLPNAAFGLVLCVFIWPLPIGLFAIMLAPVGLCVWLRELEDTGGRAPPAKLLVRLLRIGLAWAVTLGSILILFRMP